MAVFKCKMCGGALEIAENATTVTCDYCGSGQTLPRLSDDKISRLYDRAGHFRRNNEFDKAAAIYEEILNEDNTDAEAYWSLVLCGYGIEYVEDPKTKRRVPTVNRVQFTSIFDDANYKSALEYADIGQKGMYEAEAKAINEIQKGILAISQKEDPFDVFICYKETDENGKRTRDSVYANELYHELTEVGFKVFYARITLEDKLGVAYEPYIFAALNSAKVMVVIGTKPEYFNAVWVKNEWSRFLALIKNDSKKVLIPAYSGMDPYDLPEEFSHLQAQDMTKLGFMPDLVRGIKKVIGFEQPKPTTVNTAPVSSGTEVVGGKIEPLLKRAKIFLENQDWTNADAKCEAVLDMDPENGTAYLYKALAYFHKSNETQLTSCDMPLDSTPAFTNAVRYCNDAKSEELLRYRDEVKEKLHKRDVARQEGIRRQNEIRTLENARDNATNLISSQIREKESWEKILAEKEHANVNFEEYAKKLKKSAKRVKNTFFLGIVFFVLAMIVMNTDPYADGESIMGLWAICFILTTVFTVMLARKLDLSMLMEGIKCYFTIGICGFLLARKTLKQIKVNSFPQECQQIRAKIQEIEKQIENTRHSLSEINGKLRDKQKG